MEIEHWQKIEAIYHAALEQNPLHWAEFVRQACGRDESLNSEVLSLLAKSDEAESFLDEPALQMAARELAVSSASDSETLISGSQPLLIGRYRVIRLLGEGGMGTVYEAEQQEPCRIVALKVIRPGLATPERLRRFRHESQALGRLQHPGIAQIYEAGTADTGFGPQPWFAMELVRGPSLEKYFETHPMNTRQKLELMAKICAAVHHAHQRGLIHRDLKPGNILIDAAGQPKILDFGVARVTEGEASLTLQTEVGEIVGTLAYMSPEQVLGDPLEIDTRSDVYSLGVILYEILAGRPPYNVSGRQVHEAVHTIREVDPESLSGISRNLRGDVETIVCKALEKDKTRRYASAAALEADIQNFLNDEPILARPPSASYQLRKFARRHRVAVGVASGLVLMLSAFSVLQAVELVRITRERDRAARITSFMTEMFKVSDPNQARGNTVTAREILDKASKDMESGLAKDPEVQSEMMHVMASTYQNLGLYPRAHELAKRALDARRNLLGPNHPRTLESLTQLGWIVDREGHYGEADTLERQALASERRVLGPQDPLAIETMDHMAVILEDEGRYVEAEKLAREAIEIATRKLGPENSQTLLSMNHLGRALWYQARYAEAEQEYRQLVDADRRALGPDHPQTLSAMSSLAVSLEMERRSAEAEQMDRGVLAGELRVLGHEHQSTALTMENLASLLDEEGRFADGEKLHREALGIRQRTLGPEHPETLASQFNLAECLFKQGHFQEAEKLQRETLATQARLLGPEDPDVLTSQSNLAGILIREGQYAEAETLARKTVDVQLRILGPQHPDTLVTLQHVGAALAHRNRYSEATRLYQDLIEKQGNSGGQGNKWSLWYSFACMAASADHPDDAVKYLKEAITRGYKDADGMVSDDDLKTLSQNPHFQELVATLRRPPIARQ
jgi:non-specific serine/threonine protein kinase/serine/threonine-protein kinase